MSAWADQSGNGNGVVQGTGASQPTFVASSATFGGQPTVQFATGGINMTNSGYLINQTDTVYAAVSQSTNGLIMDGSVVRQAMGVNVTNWMFFAGASVTSGTAGDTNPHAFAAVFNGASSNLYLDSSAAVLVSGNASGNGLSGLVVNSTNIAFAGLLAEFLIYAGVHGPSQVSQVFRYLGARYGKTWA